MTGISFNEEAGIVRGSWLVSGADLETAIDALWSHQLFVHDEWTGNQYWWVKADVPEWLAFIRKETPEAVRAVLGAAVVAAPDAPRVTMGGLRRTENAPLGFFLATDENGVELPFGFPPNHAMFVERMTGATDWRFTMAGRVQVFAAIDDSGLPCGIVTAVVPRRDA